MMTAAKRPPCWSITGRRPGRRGIAALVGLALASPLPAAASGDVAAGSRVFAAQCVACHSDRPGIHKTGPSLAGVYGRRAGSSDFAHYQGLVGADFVWDDALLDAYLRQPKDFVLAHTGNTTTAMTFSLADPVDRQDVISLLKTLDE